MKEIENLRKVVQQVLATGGEVSEINYVGLGVYQGAINASYRVTENQMAEICALLDLKAPKRTVWDSELGVIQNHPGCHSHSISIS
ncbi:hypothetical protein [Klebsiella aerogenes]|uniref:hypothetical protein n=1 Tax=Klebsiella aerogenes TaxID=548 RepID=UPI000A81A82B|nr:hypothetical protein [Klebsiella aerogenes]